MITVTYLPSGENSPLPNKEKMFVFLTHGEFQRWVQKYVCIHCLVDFKQMYGYNPSTLADWLDMGCGCEIYVEDPDGVISWDHEMILPQDFEEVCKKYETS